MKYVTAAINAGLDLHRNEISSGLMADELIQGWLDFALWAIETWEKCDRFLDQWQSLADETRAITKLWMAPLLPLAMWVFLAIARCSGWCWGHCKRWWWMAWDTAIAELPTYSRLIFDGGVFLEGEFRESVATLIASMQLAYTKAIARANLFKTIQQLRLLATRATGNH